MGFLGGGTSFNDYTNANAQGYQNPAFNNFLSKYPVGNSGVPGGANIQSGANRFIGLKGTGIPWAIQHGKLGGHLSNEQRQAILANPGHVSLDNLNNFLINRAKGKGQKIQQTPFNQFNPDPSSAAYFDFMKNAALENAKRQDQFNQTLRPTLDALSGLNQKAIGSASNYIDRGFTENDPRMQAEINSAGEAFYNQGAQRFKRDYLNTVQGANEDLAANGTPIGRGTGAADYLNQRANIPLADNLQNLSYQSEVYKQNLADQKLNQARSGYATLAGTPSFNSSLQGLQLPDISQNYNATFGNPGGQFNINDLLQALQFSNNYGLQAQQLKQQPYVAGIPNSINSDAATANPWGKLIGSLFGNAQSNAKTAATIAAAG